LDGGKALRKALEMNTTQHHPAIGLAAPAGRQPPVKAPGPIGPTLEGMSRTQCLAMLETSSIGRIAYTAANRLTVVPVNFRLHTGMIILRTAEDSSIAQYALEPVAFEVDRIDEQLHAGWSVLVNGMVRPATDDEAAQVHDLVEPWAGGNRDTCMVIEPAQISGRRLRAW
jgi:hypothetical protein